MIKSQHLIINILFNGYKLDAMANFVQTNDVKKETIEASIVFDETADETENDMIEVLALKDILILYFLKDRQAKTKQPMTKFRSKSFE